MAMSGAAPARDAHLGLGQGREAKKSEKNRESLAHTSTSVCQNA
jgi:hypothetical protein